MDKEKLLQAEIQSFIQEHEGDDLHQLMLQKEKYSHLPLPDIIEQISGRKRAKKKLPSWYETKNILYPSAVSVEQSSSEITARYKAGLFSGSAAVDLTGGFGVDSFYLAQKFNSFNYVEKNEDLANIAQHNFTCLRQHNIIPNISTAEDFITADKNEYDLIFIDPDRRPGEKRVHGFKQSKPDLNALLPELLKISDQILIKASPMMDITQGIRELQHVKMVIVLAVDNEVKELLFWINSKADSLKIRCVNLKKEEEQILEYNAEQEHTPCKTAMLANYLYEPNAAIMKAGAHAQICGKFDLKKLNRNTHIYTSDKYLSEFPGRRFKVIAETNYNKQHVRAFLSSMKANISVRNFPDTPAQVKNKLGLKDGGEHYIFGFSNMNNEPKIAVCAKA
jgi:16S rRNA G966 N2-methylase RsmD